MRSAIKWLCCVLLWMVLGFGSASAMDARVDLLDTAPGDPPWFRSINTSLLAPVPAPATVDVTSSPVAYRSDVELFTPRTASCAAPGVTTITNPYSGPDGKIHNAGTITVTNFYDSNNNPQHTIQVGTQTISGAFFLTTVNFTTHFFNFKGFDLGAWVYSPSINSIATSNETFYVRDMTLINVQASLTAVDATVVGLPQAGPPAGWNPDPTTDWFININNGLYTANGTGTNIAQLINLGSLGGTNVNSFSIQIQAADPVNWVYTSTTVNSSNYVPPTPLGGLDFGQGLVPAPNWDAQDAAMSGDLTSLTGGDNCCCGGDPAGGAVATGDPVNPLSGQFIYAHTDISIPSRGLPLTVSRLHQTQQLVSSGMPAVWNWNVVWWLSESTETSPRIKTTYPTGDWGEFATTDGKTFTPEAAFADITDTITQNADGSLDLVSRAGTKCHFTSFGSRLGIETIFLIQSMTDRYGNTLTWSYSGGALTDIKDKAGRGLHFTMDPIVLGGTDSPASLPFLDVKIHQIKDDLGRVWAYDNYVTFPGLGSAPQTFTAPEGRVWAYTYSAHGRILTVTDPRGNLECSNTYDANEATVTHQVRANGDAWDYQYTTNTDGTRTTLSIRSRNGIAQGADAYAFATNGACTRHADADGHADSFVRNAAGRLTQMTDALGNVKSFTWDGNGNLVSETDTHGKTWAFQYGVFNLITQATSPLQQVWKFVRDSQGSLVQSIDPLNHVITTTFDASGLPLSVTNAIGNTWTIGYNSYGDVVSLTNPLQENITFSIDLVGRTTAVTDALGHTSSRTIDGANRTILAQDALGNKATMKWDPAGNLLQMTDALKRTTQMAYNTVNQSSQVTDAIGGQSSFQYDGRNNFAGLVNANNVVAAQDTNNEEDVPTQENLLGDKTSVQYDAEEKPVLVTRPNGQTFQYVWDELYRLVHWQGSDGSTCDYSYDDLGRRIKMVDNVGTTTYTWDATNRLVAVNQYGHVIQYAFDAANRLISRIDPEGMTTTFEYDSANRLVHAVCGTLEIRMSYDAAGRLTQKACSNGIVCNYSWDDGSRLVSKAWLDGNHPIAGDTYTYDPVGNRTSKVAITPGRNVDGQSFAYDGLNRLIGSTDQSNGHLVTWAYDGVGNRLSQGGTNQGQGSGSSTVQNVSYSYNKKDQLLTANDSTFSWDSDGNLLSQTEGRNTTNYSWDAKDQLARITFSDGTYQQNLYNGDGMRVATIDREGTRHDFVWSGSEILSTYAGGALETAYFMAGTRVAIMDSPAREQPGTPPTSHWYVSDAQESTIALTNAVANATDSYEYDPWGNLTKATGAADNPFLYTGQQFDAETGMYYLRARHYDPKIGRFVSRDPVGYLAGTNLYAYASNNSPNRADPSGTTDFDSPDAAVRDALRRGQLQEAILRAQTALNDGWHGSAAMVDLMQKLQAAGQGLQDAALQEQTAEAALASGTTAVQGPQNCEAIAQNLFDAFTQLAKYENLPDPTILKIWPNHCFGQIQEAAQNITVGGNHYAVDFGGQIYDFYSQQGSSTHDYLRMFMAPFGVKFGEFPSLQAAIGFTPP